VVDGDTIVVEGVGRVPLIGVEFRETVEPADLSRPSGRKPQTTRGASRLVRPVRWSSTSPRAVPPRPVGSSWALRNELRRTNS